MRTSCLGSSTIPQGRFTNFGHPAYPDPVDFIVQGHEFVPRQGETYNFAPLNYYQRPDEQYTLGAFAHYDLSEQTQVYTELMYMDNRTVAQIAPSGAFFVTETLQLRQPADVRTAVPGAVRGDRQEPAKMFSTRSGSAVATWRAATASTTCNTPRSAGCSACRVKLSDQLEL